MCVPVVRTTNVQKGKKVKIQYFMNFKEQCKTLINPTEEEVEQNKEDCGSKCYTYGEVITIPISSITQFITDNFRLVQPKTEYNAKPVDIPPYILGVWLGDGTASRISITSVHKPVIVAWNEFAKQEDMEIREQKKSTRITQVQDDEVNHTSEYNITAGSDAKGKQNATLEKFRRLNLINNKHIPDVYLENSAEVRLKLLAGLLDTDGTKDGNSYQIIQKSETLSNNIVSLARSLGFITTMNKCQKKCTNSPDPNHCGEYYRMSILTNETTPFLPLKCAKKRIESSNKVMNQPMFDSDGQVVDRSKTTTGVIWTETLQDKLIATVLSFEKIEPKQQIPWTRLHEFNSALPSDKSDSMRGTYKRLKKANNWEDRVKNIELFHFDPIEKDWNEKYEMCKEELEKKDGRLIDNRTLYNWYNNQKALMKSSDGKMYQSKKDKLASITAQ